MFVNLKSPPGDDVTMDLQVLRDGTWTSILAGPLTVAAGFDGVLSVEHEDGLMSSSEGFAKGVEFLRGLIIRERAGAMWWA